VISASTPDWENRRLGCVGVPLPNLDVGIYDVNSNTIHPMSSSNEGEVIVHGPSVMVGYHNNPKANEEVFMYLHGKRYFRTGDLGRFIDGKVSRAM
jgi:fatty-acyl-CoA synthase